MKKGLTELVFILDKSGSMSGLEADTIGRMIHKIGNAQKNTADDYRAEKVIFVVITDGEGYLNGDTPNPGQAAYIQPKR